jgi:hypothetical protein
MSDVFELRTRVRGDEDFEDGNDLNVDRMRERPHECTWMYTAAHGPARDTSELGLEPYHQVPAS